MQEAVRTLLDVQQTPPGIVMMSTGPKEKHVIIVMLANALIKNGEATLNGSLFWLINKNINSKHFIKPKGVCRKSFKE